MIKSCAVIRLCTRPAVRQMTETTNNFTRAEDAYITMFSDLWLLVVRDYLYDLLVFTQIGNVGPKLFQ